MTRHLLQLISHTRPFSIRAKLLLFFGLSIITLFAIMGSINYFGFPFGLYEGEYRKGKETTIQRLTATADDKKNDIAHWFDKGLAGMKICAGDSMRMAFVRRLASSYRSGKGVSRPDPRLEEWLSSIRDAFQYDAVEVVDSESGFRIFTTEQDQPRIKSPVYEELFAGGTDWTDRIFFAKGKNNDKSFLYLAYLDRVASDDGAERSPPVALLFRMDMGSPELVRILHGSLALGDTGEIVLVDMQKRLLAPLKNRLPDNTAPRPLDFRLSTRPAEFAAFGIDGVLEAKDYRGVPVIAAVRHYRVTPEFGLGIIVKQDDREIFSPLRKGLFISVSIITTGLIVLLVILYLLAVALLQPLETLNMMARRVEAGDLGARVDVETNDECGVLAGTFNLMADNIQRWHREFESQVLDQTEQIRAQLEARILIEDALRSNEEKFRSLFENAIDGIFILSASGKLLDLNSSFASMHGYTVEEMRSMKLSDLDTPETAKLAPERIRRLLTGEALTFEIEHYCKDKLTIPLEVSASLVTINDEKCILGFHRDISERKMAEMALRKSEQNFRAIIEVSPMPLALNDDMGNIIYLNKAFVNTIGYTTDDIPVLEKWWPLAYPDEQYRQLVTDTWVKHLEDAKHTGLPFVPMEINIACKDGSVRTFICSTAPLEESFTGSHLVIFYDITDRKRAEVEKLALEQQFQQTQKLESLGILAGGIAHDFNNILMAIIGNADLALMRINKESPAIENLHRIEQAAARAADLAKQMLAYSGKGKFVVENLDLNILLQEMLHMLEVSISKKAVLRFNPYNPLPSIEADATQMRQIIMNLVINASEAIGDRSGIIAITTGCMNCDTSYLRDVWLNVNISEGLYVYLEIADTGCGMNKETMARLFDPFFTTKFTGRGLGMAAVLGIVRGHKGAIKVYSEIKKGSTFKILLPAYSRPAELFNHDSQHDDWKGSGKVLLVDDEETVRGIGSEMLKELGLDVITAVDGREAVKMYKSCPDISFVILDLTMPHMDGEQCFRELRQLNRDVKVIISSGYNEQEVTQKFVGKGLAGFIQKPYKLSTLREAIKKQY